MMNNSWSCSRLVLEIVTAKKQHDNYSFQEEKHEKSTLTQDKKSKKTTKKEETTQKENSWEDLVKDIHKQHQLQKKQLISSETKKQNSWQIGSKKISLDDQGVVISSDANGKAIFVLLPKIFYSLEKITQNQFLIALSKGFSKANPNLTNTSGIKYLGNETAFEVKINGDARLCGSKIYNNNNGQALYIIENKKFNHNTTSNYANDHKNDNTINDDDDDVEHMGHNELEE